MGLCSSVNKLEDDSEVMLPSISVHMIEQAPQMASANAYVPRMNFRCLLGDLQVGLTQLLSKITASSLGPAACEVLRVPFRS